MGLLSRALGVPDVIVPTVALEPRPARPAPVRVRKRAFGGYGTRISAGLISSIDHNTETQGDKWYGSRGTIGIAGKMLRDAHVRRSVDVLVSPLRAADWRFKPASNEPIDQEIADFCRYVFIERLDWDAIVKRMATGYIAYGFALSEMTDDLLPIPAGRFPNHPGAGTALVVTGIHDRPQDTVYRWHQSKENPAQLESLEQWLNNGTSEVELTGSHIIPADRLIRMTFDQQGANFEGFPVLRSAYGSWKTKIMLLAIDAIRHERVGLGTPTVIAGEDASEDDIEALEDVLSEMRVNEKGYIVLPNGYTFDWKGVTVSDGTDIAAAIDRCNRDIAINVAAHFTILGVNTQTGSYALADSQEGQFHIEVDGHARFFANALNHGQDGWSPIERIVRANYGPNVVVPRIEAHNLPTRDWVTFVKMVNDAARAGTVQPDDKLEAQLRDAMMLGPKDAATVRAAQPSPAVGFGSKPQEETDDA